MQAWCSALGDGIALGGFVCLAVGKEIVENRRPIRPIGGRAPDEVLQRGHEVELERIGARVGEGVGQNGNRNPAVVGVGWGQRVKGLEHHVHRYGGVAEMHGAKRVACIEAGRTKARQAVMGDRRAECPLVVRQLQRSLERFDNGVSPWRLDAHGHEGRVGAEPFGRPITYLPIAQIPPPAQRDGAGADAADGHGDVAQVCAVVGMYWRTRGAAHGSVLRFGGMLWGELFVVGCIDAGHQGAEQRVDGDGDSMACCRSHNRPIDGGNLARAAAQDV